MARPLLSHSATRRLSQQSSRLFSTSQATPRLSACSVGEAASRRQIAAQSAWIPTYSTSVTSASLQRFRFCQQSAPFSSTSTRPATKVLQNPRTGDEGEALMINISPRAVEVGVESFHIMCPSCFCMFPGRESVFR